MSAGDQFRRWKVQPAAQVVERAVELAAAVIELVEVDPVAELRPAAAGPMDAAAFELAVLAQDAPEMLGQVGPRWIDDAGCAALLVWMARNHLEREPDALRSTRLLRLVSGQVPPNRFSFAPRHVRQARSLAGVAADPVSIRAALDEFSPRAVALS